MAQDTHRRARAFLQTDPMRHLVHLKFLHLYNSGIDCIYHEADGEGGVLLSYPIALSTKDRESYSPVERVFLPTASGEGAALALAGHILSRLAPSQTTVIKFCDPVTRQAFENSFRLSHARTVISFTTDQPADSFAGADEVVIGEALDEALARLYTQNGYTEAELRQYFADGARSFTIYDDGGEPLCTCLAFRNFERVWEIGALRTVERARRKGYARRVVATAIHTVLQNGWIPRYQSEASNTASIALAESMGLNICLRFEHHLATPCVQGNS